VILQAKNTFNEKEKKKFKEGVTFEDVEKFMFSNHN
jgi:hypothetical protein